MVCDLNDFSQVLYIFGTFLNGLTLETDVGQNDNHYNAHFKTIGYPEIKSSNNPPI